MNAAPWLAGDSLFRRDTRWLGGDDAYSIALGDGRRLWLFGDTFVAREPGGERRDAWFLHSSVAVQHGDDPAVAEVRYHWAGTADRPMSFLPDTGDGGYRWPAHGALVDGALVLFTMRIRDRDQPTRPGEVETLVFFEVEGWDAFVVRDVTGDPGSWVLEPAQVPASAPAPLVGAAVLIDDGWLYAHAVDPGSRSAYLGRWPVAEAGRGDLRGATWWCGDGWAVDVADAVATVTPAETEFTVHREGDGFVLAQCAGLFDPRLEVRHAPAIWGPWDEPQTVFRPSRHPDAFSYAGKAHPGLSSAGLAFTYNTIPTTLAELRRRTDLYVPRLVRLGGSAPVARRARQPRSPGTTL